MSGLDKNWQKELLHDRQQVQLSDQAAHQKFYACFLKQNEERLLPFIQQLQDKWAEADNE